MSYRVKIDPKSRKAARFISRLQKKVQAALVQSGKTQQEVAETLGVDRSVINRRLKGSANLTARSIAEFAYAFDMDVDVSFVRKSASREKNWSTTHNNIVVLEPLQAPSVARTDAASHTFSLESAAS